MTADLLMRLKDTQTGKVENCQDLTSIFHGDKHFILAFFWRYIVFLFLLGQFFSISKNVTAKIIWVVVTCYLLQKGYKKLEERYTLLKKSEKETKGDGSLFLKSDEKKTIIEKTNKITQENNLALRFLFWYLLLVSVFIYFFILKSLEFPDGILLLALLIPPVYLFWRRIFKKRDKDESVKRAARDLNEKIKNRYKEEIKKIGIVNQ